MNCCHYQHCEATENHFGRAFAEAELRRYKQKGPGITTRILLKTLKIQELHEVRLLDIGGGIGVMMHELFPERISNAILLEASAANLTLAETEARRGGYHERVQYVHGDFVEVAETIPAADLVTLDRVVCCYPDMERLVKASIEKSAGWYALSYPRNKWYVRVHNAYKNWRRSRRGNRFRTYLHDERRIDELIRKAGFQRCFHRATFMWNISLYRRSGDT